MRRIIVGTALATISLVACSQTGSAIDPPIDVGIDSTIQAVTVQPPPPANLVYVKYRKTPVNLTTPPFQHQPTSGSSFVRGAWYDRTNQYMIIRLNQTYYQYCRMPSSVWVSLTIAESYGGFYNSRIKGNYGCATQSVPNYP